MATTTIFTLSAAVLLLATTGCKKNAAPETKGNNQAAALQTKTISASSFTYYNYGEDITEADFLVNEHDAADQAFNYVNHAMTLGLLDIYQNNATLMAGLVSEINASKNKELNLYKVADAHPEIDGIMNRVFAERFSDFNTGNWRSYVAAHYVYDTPYVPFIGFMNIGTVDGSMPAYVSEPLELNEEKFTQFDDDYPMWVMDRGAAALKFTSVNEAQGYYLTNPIVRIANGFAGDDLADYMKVPSQFEENGKDISMNTVPQERPSGAGGNVSPIYPGQQPQQYPQKDEWLTHVKFRINERYENWGKSEYQFSWTQGAAFNIVNFKWVNYPGGPINSIEKALKKEEIGTEIPFYFDVFHSGNYAAQYNYLKFRIQYMPADTFCYFAVAAFERDWGAGRKLLYWLCQSTKPTKGPRKYDDEWYFIDPANNTGYPFNLRNPNYHTSYWNYTKGVLQLHRWNL